MYLMILLYILALLIMALIRLLETKLALTVMFWRLSNVHKQDKIKSEKLLCMFCSIPINMACDTSSLPFPFKGWTVLLTCCWHLSDRCKKPQTDAQSQSACADKTHLWQLVSLHSIILVEDHCLIKQFAVNQVYRIFKQCNKQPVVITALCSKAISVLNQ